MKLYTFYGSSAAYRVRIALNLKGLTVEPVAIDLVRDAQFAPGYVAVNPQSIVPSLAVEGQTLTQSLAILEYLEEIHPEPALLPKTPIDRAWVRALALAIACEIHPLSNRRVREYLKGEMAASSERRHGWNLHWIETGLAAIEAALARDPRVGRYCYGDEPGFADCFLVPQFYNAERYHCAIEAFPTISRIVATCREHPAFQDAAPERQPDAE